MILYINATIKKESRTNIIAKELLKKLNSDYKEIKLIDIKFPKVDEAYINKRDYLIKNNMFNDSMFKYANEFRNADIIVIAAPYWDLSFPSILKQYLEIINVIGITFKYDDKGIPIGLCNCKKLYYITTSGGINLPYDYGYGYIKALADTFYGIEDVKLINACGLDIVGANTNDIIEKCIKDEILGE